MRLLKWLAIFVLVVIVIPLAVVFLINLRDEKLIPEAAAFMKVETPNVPEQQNAFYYVLGFEAPLKDDPHQAGKAYFTAVDSLQQEMLKGARAEWPPQPKGLPKIDAMCVPEKASCIRLLKETAEARRALVEQAPVVARYRRVHSYPAYFEATQAQLYNYPITPFGSLGNAQRLFLLDVAERLERGEIAEAIAALRDDIAFSRRMLAGSRTLLHKMVAGSELQRGLLFTSDALTTYRDKIGARAAPLLEVLKPLTDDERAITPGLRSELILAASAMEPSRWRGEGLELPVDAALLKPFYKHNATVNMIYRLSRSWADVDNAIPDKLFDAFERAKAGEPQYSISKMIYNPVGKFFFFNNTPTLNGYFERMHDLDALVRMIGLQADIVAQEPKADDLAAVIQKSKNPYTGKPFDWDAEKQQLSFEARNRLLKDQKVGGTAGRVTVRLNPS